MLVSYSKIKDFTGQNIYVGLDVHAKSWSVSIYSDELELKTFTQVPCVNQLYKHLISNYPNANFQVGYEAGFSGFGVKRALEVRGISCLVINPADVPSSQRETKRKTDKVDSRKLSKALRSGVLTGIYVPDQQQEENRNLLRLRGKLVKDRTRVKNRIKGLLKFSGIELPTSYQNTNWSNAFIKWLEGLPLQGSNKLTLQLHLQELLFFQQKEKEATKHIKELARTDYYREDVRLLTTIPGAGIIAAMILLTEIGSISRFRKLEHLNSYCGLTPNTHSSGDSDRVTGMSKMGNGILKTILVECAWMAIRKDPALLLYYKQCLPRMKSNKAIIKVTRKLLNRIRYVLLNRKEYVKGIVE